MFRSCTRSFLWVLGIGFQPSDPVGSGGQVQQPSTDFICDDIYLLTLVLGSKPSHPVYHLSCSAVSPAIGIITERRSRHLRLAHAESKQQSL